MRNLRKFAAVPASASNHFNGERSLPVEVKLNRGAALGEWRGVDAAAS